MACDSALVSSSTMLETRIEMLATSYTNLIEHSALEVTLVSMGNTKEFENYMSNMRIILTTHDVSANTYVSFV